MRKMIGTFRTRFTIWYVKQGYSYMGDTFYCPLWVRPLLIFFSPVRYYVELYGKIYTESFAKGFEKGLGYDIVPIRDDCEEDDQMANDPKRISEPDGVMPNGAPIYLKIARGNGKPMLQLEIYRKLCEISDDEWADMKVEIAKELGWFEDDTNND